MDYKGIGWAGNVYEKLQTMCLEVEEGMREDSVKHVENQVDKVGESIKKFYAEVLVGLIPPSCIKPVRRAAAARLEPCTRTDINQKPYSIISDIHDRCELTPVSVAAAADLPLEPYTQTDTNQKPNSTISDIHDEGEGEGIVQSGEISICSVASDDLNVTRSSEFFVRHNSGDAVTENTPTSDASVELCNSYQILSAESVYQEMNVSKCTCPAPDKDLYAPIDSFDIEVIESEDVLEPGHEFGTYEPVEKSEVEESCVMVEGDELYFVSQGQRTKKHKSYKKKIYEVLSSKVRPTRKIQCVSNYEDSSETNNAGGMSPALTMDCDKRKLPAHNSCDFDWELLELQ